MTKVIVYSAFAISSVLFLLSLFVFYEASRPKPGANMVLYAMIYVIPIQIWIALLAIYAMLANWESSTPLSKKLCIAALLMSILPPMAEFAYEFKLLYL